MEEPLLKYTTPDIHCQQKVGVNVLISLDIPLGKGILIVCSQCLT